MGTTIRWGLLSGGTTIRWDYYPVGLLSGGTTIRWDYYPVGLLSGGTTIRWDYYPVGLLSGGATIRLDFYPVGLLSGWTTIRWERCNRLFFFCYQNYLREMLNVCSTLRTCHLNVPEGQTLTKWDLCFFHNFFKQGIFEQTRAYNAS